jgi:HK97 family phage prohead protease
MKPIKGQIEKRSFAGELRADAGAKFEVSGYAASFNTLSRDLGGFREQLAPGCFKRSLAEGTDVKCLFNHDANVVLGRVGNKTLAVSEDARGLKFTCQLNPASQQHRDIYESVKRGDVSQCSFAFTVRDGAEDWDNAEDERGAKFARRTIREVNLLDVSAVTYPAYSAPGATSVQARAADYIATSAAAFDAMAKRKAQKIKEQIFQTCDAFTLPDEYIEGQPWEPIPVFFTPEQKAAREAARLDAEDAELRRRADAIGRQIEIDTLRDLYGE